MREHTKRFSILGARDYSLAWSRLHRDAASCCEVLGLPHLAIYVALHHHDPSIGAHVARDLLHRTAPEWYPSVAAALSTAQGIGGAETDAEAKTRFLLCELGIPSSWLMECAADYMRNLGKPVRELRFHMLSGLADRVRRHRAVELFREQVAPRLLLAKKSEMVIRFSLSMRATREDRNMLVLWNLDDLISLRPAEHAEDAYLTHQAIRRARATTEEARNRQVEAWRSAGRDAELERLALARLCSSEDADMRPSDPALELSSREAMELGETARDDEINSHVVAEMCLNLLAASGILHARASNDMSRLSAEMMAGDASRWLFSALFELGSTASLDVAWVKRCMDAAASAPLNATQLSHFRAKAAQLAMDLPSFDAEVLD